MDEARCGAICPGKLVPVLKIEGKCSCLRAKPAHIPGHLPAASSVSMKQISLKPGGRLIALALTAKKQCLPVGF